MADGEVKLRTADFELPPDVDLARARICAAALEGFLSSVHNIKGITCWAGLTPGSHRGKSGKTITITGLTDTDFVPAESIPIALEFISGFLDESGGKDNDDKPAG